MEFRFRNVNDAFAGLVRHFQQGGEYRDGASRTTVVRRESRNGPVLMIDEPVLITYERPTERVLFNSARDANPFFHLYESLWMLAGRNDLAPLTFYARQMEKYSDDGQTLNGAYGYRWRKFEWNRPEMEHFDQLDWLVDHLKGDPTSRRAVLQMWDVGQDLVKIGIKWGPDYCDQPASRDVCCNLSVMFALRRVTDEVCHGPAIMLASKNYLDMTVTNRSNDLVWGLLGANYVHFSVLQEYMAARLGAAVGKYHTLTNNLHVYVETNSGFKPDEWLGEGVFKKYQTFGTKEITPFPLVRDPAAFEAELPAFVEHHSGKVPAAEQEGTWDEPFLQGVAGPLLCAFACHKAGDTHSALMCVEGCAADDWRLAGTNWLKRRAK